MTYKRPLLTIINILSTFGLPYQEAVLINQLNNAFSFDHNIFLLHSSANVDRFIVASESLDFTPKSLFRFETIDGNIQGFEIPRRLQGTNTLLIVATNSSHVNSNMNLLKFVKNVQIVNVDLKIGLFLPSANSLTDLRHLFQWCWTHRIINIFVAFNAKVTQGSNAEPLLNIFYFNPFGTFRVLNVTGGVSMKNIFHGQKINFQQHPFRLAVVDDESIAQYSSTVPFMNGPDERMWKAVCKALNASYTLFLVRKVLEPVEVLNNGTVDIHADLSELTEQGTVTLYPLIIEILSIVVPKALPYPAFAAYIQTMFSDGFFGYFLITILIVMLVLTLCRYIRRRRIQFFQSAVDVLNLLLNDNGAIVYPQLTRSEVFLMIPLTFAGFVIVNGFLSNLKSHFTQPKIQPQIDTVDDYYESGLTISAPNEFWMKKVIQLLNNLAKYDDWGGRMRVNNSSEVIRQIVSDTTFSFVEYESTARGICKYRKFHITQIQLQWIWYSYNVRYDFPFTKHVNEVIQWVQSAGLYKKWWRDFDEEQLWKSYGNESHADSFSVPIFIVYGWIAGLIVLVLEVTWNKYSKIANRIFKVKL